MSAYERATIWITAATAVGTILAAFFGGWAAWIFMGQLEALQKQLREMESSGKQVESLISLNKDLSEATKIGATSKRAILFLDLVYSNGGDERDAGPMVAFELKYSIRNSGESPAIIRKIVAHMYLSENKPNPSERLARENAVIPSEGTAVVSYAGMPPPPEAPHDIALKDEPSIIFATSRPFVLQANSVFAAQDLSFGFYRSRTEALAHPNPKSYWMKRWVLLKLFYDDVYGYPRETSYFGQFVGTSPFVTEDAHYNFWN